MEGLSTSFERWLLILAHFLSIVKKRIDAKGSMYLQPYSHGSGGEPFISELTFTDQ
jgi:hypothetical protein